MSIKVIVAGFKGRMGSTAVEMVKGDDELTLAALLDPFATEKEVDGIYPGIPSGPITLGRLRRGDNFPVRYFG